MSLLADIQTFWQATFALSSLGRLYLTSAPDDQSYPYFTLNLIAQIPNYTTGSPYYEAATIQIHAWHTSAATVQAYLDTIQTNFDWNKFSSSVIACYRENSFLLQEEGKVFHGVLEYTVLSQRSLSSSSSSSSSSGL